MSLKIVMLGDVVGRAGRLAVAQCIPQIRDRWKPDLIVANGENAANGLGILPEHYTKLKAAGVDGITLGDHVYKKIQIVPLLETNADITRPANLPLCAKGRQWMKLTPTPAPGQPQKRSLYVITVLGRLFIGMPADDPFAAVERILAELPDKDPIVLVEIHAEATSEKQAIGWQFNGRVAAVVGTHTHVATADARILAGGFGTAYISDIGMCGPQESVLGRQIDPVLQQMTTGMYSPFEVAEGDPRVCGIYFEVDEKTRRTVAVERIELCANDKAPPFTS